MRRLLSLILLAITTCSCTKVDESCDAALLSERAVSFVISQVASRVVDNGVSTTWQVGDEVAIYTSDGSYENVKYRVVSSDGGLSFALEAATDEVIESSDEAVDYYLYYPYRESGAVAIDLNNPETEPIITAVAKAQSGSSVSFEPATHQLARLQINIYSAAGDTSDIEGATIVVSGSYTTGQFSHSAAFSDLATGDLSSQVMLPEGDESYGCVEFYVIPTSLKDLDVEVEVETSAGDLYVATISSSAWVAATRYSYDVYIGE